MSEDLTGTRLGHYRIDGVLGRGGMSVMYRATDVRLGRKVALKVIGEHLGGDAEFRERFVDEARNTSAIDHPNVVPLYDFGDVDGKLYIAMRLVDGPDLAGLINGGPLAPRRTLALLGQIAEALDTLHGRGLVHLDLKPANVFVTSMESSKEHIYLGDFGLTRRGVTGHRTRTGDFLGSPTYAAPEHLRGEPVDGRADAYSLACMLFACCTGRPPYQGDVQDVIKGHLTLDPPAVSRVVALPSAIDDVVRRGMSKEPDARYGGCAELIAAARAALGEAADSPEAPEQAGRASHTDIMAPVSPPAGVNYGPSSGPQPTAQPSAQGPAGQPGASGAHPPSGSFPAHQPLAQQHPNQPGGMPPRPPMPSQPPIRQAHGAPQAESNARKWVVAILAGAVALVAIVLIATLVAG
ncbi:serine/threonine-protein kinase [Tamaricihabitans halophyticus]|uniref:non-specific serine/threonine protein kinase n=1 Tax=Tamaricihabitans halophyticus TaxID=1262583 RepID=A0A4R2R251_9PSEU|nr:serine/threonine-protein kinase [Tamaricihabitans halophyticus]TCP56593.1 serine/threonine-protein kinase [Tamaricihabitans halophyticus]